MANAAGGAAVVGFCVRCVSLGIDRGEGDGKLSYPVIKAVL